MSKALLTRRILIFFILLTIFINVLRAQQSVGKETLGLEYFQQGNFEKALPIFARLALSYPDNAMYNYYYGVSLIKNNLFETAAKEALLNSVVDKTPSNANFYLGNYFHALGEWQEAMDFYDRYGKSGSRQEKKELEYDRMVGLCKQKINPFKRAQATDSALFGDTLLKPPPKIDEKNFPIPEALKKAWINFQINEILAYHSIDDFRSEASKILFTKAWICTGKNDSLLLLTDSLRRVHDRIARVETRLGLVQQIVDCEQKSYQLGRDREKLLDQSRAKESAYWEREGKKLAMEYNTAIQNRENKLKESKKNLEAVVNIPPVNEVVKDTIKKENEPQTVADVTETRSEPQTIIYKVRLGSFRNGVMTPVFKQSYAKISKLRKIDKYTDEKGFVAFTVGTFTSFTDATRMKEQLIREGMKGALVVGFDKTTGKIMKALPPIPEKKLEPTTESPQKESNLQVESPSKPTAIEGILFKVQIGSFRNDLQPTAFRKARTRIGKQVKIDRVTDSKNNVIYFVGEYSTYQEATKQKDRMVSEGIRDAFVAAFQNGKRIKINEAIKLAGGK